MAANTRESLAPFFSPRSVAIVGASSVPGKLGNLAVLNLKRCGFPGAIYPINPSAAAEGETKVYARIGDVGAPIDCAMVLLPAGKIVETARECAAAGVKCLVIGASGFAETGTKEGFAWQVEIGEIARASGMRVLGPNTNGLVCTPSNLSLGFNSEHTRLPRGGPISIVSHSGALQGGVTASLRGLGSGLNHFVAVGNEVDVSMLDVIEYLLDEEGTSVVGLIMEGLRDGDRFAELAVRAAKAGKRIVALKVGRSSAGARAALAHSSRLAGSARAYESLLDGCGVPLVRSVETLIGACVALTTNPKFGRGGSVQAIDRRLSCVTTSGGGGAILADFAEERHIPMAFEEGEIDEPSLREDMRPIPSTTPLGHPLDVGILKQNWKSIGSYLQVLEKHGRNGPVVAYVHSGPKRERDWDLIDVLAQRKARVDAPVVAVAPGGLDPDVQERYIAAGIPLYKDFNGCFESLAAVFYYLGRPEPALLPNPARGKVTARLDPRQAGLAFLSEIDSAAMLEKAGIPVVPSQKVASARDVEAAFDTFGGPVVLKALPPGVAHKNDSGLVILGCKTKAEAVRAFETLGDRLASQGHGADVTRLVQPMLAGKAEIIAGVTHEPGLGHFLLLGFGGVHAEILDEVLLFPIATPNDRLLSLVRESRVGRLVARLGSGPAVTEELIQVLDRLRNLVWSYGDSIDSIDINPVLVTDRGCMAVDALVCPRQNVAI